MRSHKLNFLGLTDQLGSREEIYFDQRLNLPMGFLFNSQISIISVFLLFNPQALAPNPNGIKALKSTLAYCDAYDSGNLSSLGKNGLAQFSSTKQVTKPVTRAICTFAG